MSPALTASTQPGPSVGPLPESFANMSTHSQQQKYPDHTNGSQGVAPMTVFSPLTSPALRPQGHSQPLPTQLNQNVASPPKVQGSNGNGKIRGASKNGSKTRPSPIIRPTVDTEGYSSRQSVNTNGKLANRASSSTTSGSTKRTSQQSQSAVQSPVSATGFTSFPPFQSRQQSTSVPASPAFYAAGSNASTSSIGNGNTKPFSNLNMSRLQENIAQTAVQNSPSPHQFDISGVLPAFIGMPQPPAGYAPHTSDRPSSHTPSSQTSNKPAQQNSLPSAGSLDEMMALPSPLDLNNILNMLGPNTGAAPNSVGHQSSGLPSTTFTFPGNGTQLGAPPITGLSPFDALLLHNYQQQQQHEQLIQSSFAQQHNANGSQQSVAQNNTLAIGQPQKAAPLTPASFMNLPANQYSVLSGLLADHQHPSPQLPANGTDTSRNDTVLDEYRDTKTSFGLHESSGDKKKPSSSAKYESDAVMPSKQAMKQNVLPLATSEEMHSSIALNATSPVSPALLAQNIKQVAAAAIAAKDAKSRSKAKGPSKRRSSNAAQRGESSLEQINDGKRNAKKENTNNANTLNSPEKPFHLDDGPSAAISMHGGSGPASTETSPMLSAQPDSRKSSHKVAEQRRRDSLKLCFEELRFILPPINPDEDEDYNGGPGSRRPGENNVGGQRGKNYTVDPHHPNKGISKVAMLRKSNECECCLFFR